MTDEEQKSFERLTRQCTSVTEQLNMCGASLRHSQEVNRQQREELEQVTRTNNNLLQFIKDKGLDPPA